MKLDLMLNCTCNKCECMKWRNTWKDEETFTTDCKDIRKKWQKLNRREKIMFLNSHIQWPKPTKPSRERKCSRYPKNYLTYLADSSGAIRYKVCSSNFRKILGLEGTYRWRGLLAELWEFLCSKKMILKVRTYNKNEPKWLHEFEEWFLHNVKYEQSHYGVKQIPYVCILAQDIDRIEGQGMSATPKEMLVNTFLYLCISLYIFHNLSYLFV